MTLEWWALDNKNKEVQKPAIKTEAVKNTPEVKDKTDVAKLVTAIKNNKNLDDPMSPNRAQEMLEAIKSGDVSKVLKIGMAFLNDVLWDNKWKEWSSWSSWFEDNKEIGEFIAKLKTEASTLSKEDLMKKKDEFLANLKWQEWTKRKIGMVFALSRVLDEICQKDPSKDRLKAIDKDGKPNPKPANELAIANMAQQVKPWDVLVVNKTEKVEADKLLTELRKDDLDASHVMIVTAVNPETGKITVAHSTTNKVNGEGRWVELDVNLSDYTNKYSGITLATMRPAEDKVAELLVKNVLAKKWAGYDQYSAASTALTGRNLFGKNNKYNCVELIAQSFPESVTADRKKRTHPSQVLENMDPVYIALAGSKAGEAATKKE